jgi:hypothetical protein
MSYNTAEINFFPYGFQQEHKRVQMARGEHPIYNLNVGEVYVCKSSRDYRDCFNRTSYLKSRGVVIECSKGIFRRVK